MIPYFDNTRAESEGWGVFNKGEIQRMDEAAIFENDEAAIAHVRKQAAAGSAYHLSALKACGLEVSS